ncbi:hypothetical protein GCM10022261_04020 [Brevibacterium daeguense]|uniref:Uncharacterized protein n=1 Tax=Brevibacterium daeguense TaxID=909936 RepID=A0ABP8EG93_9MICO|nr:hypothetical protein [Brevibacterium daeguense]
MPDAEAPEPGPGRPDPAGPVFSAFRVGRISAALTAVAALALGGASLLLGLAEELPNALTWFADATRLVLVLGAVATLANLVIGILVWRTERAAAEREHRRLRTWPLVAFVGLAVPLGVYVPTAVFSSDALALLIVLLLVCVPAALLLLPISRLFRP